MATSSPWAVTMSLSNTAGYNTYTCVRCTTGYDTVDLNGWQFVQRADACVSSLSTPSSSSIASVNLAYTAGAAAMAISPTSSTWAPDTVFSISAACPSMTSCTAYLAGCSTLYTGSEITVSNTAITAIKTVEAGYSYDLCIRCTNGSDTDDLDNWTVQQTSKCASSMSAGTGASVTQAYESGGSDVTITPLASGFTSWDSFFNNLLHADCAFTSCTISAAGSCGGAFTGTDAGYFSFNADSPWDLTMSVDVAAGY